MDIKKTYITAIFCSAFLLFSIQPMIAKMILPELGGSPHVWQTVMLFFQILLLCGYGYVHLTTVKLKFNQQFIFHAILISISFIFLPLSLITDITSDRNSTPILWLFESLLYSVSIPFFFLSTSAPILQRWFALEKKRTGSNDDPYFLYSSSNAGSLLALLSYPILIEPFLTLANQRLLWTGLYIFFLFPLCFLGFRIFKNNAHNQTILQETKKDPIAPPTLKQCLYWGFLAFIPSSLMLGVTTHITTDIGAFPLLWVIPFACYLLSYILVFATKMPGYKVSKILFPLAVIGALACTVVITHFVVVPISILCFFIIAIRYHGTLVTLKPTTENLTYFYLWLSIGGALGGFFNALIAPNLFTHPIEYEFILILSLVLFFQNSSKLIRFLHIAIVLFSIFTKALLSERDVVYTGRNFFGFSQVGYNKELQTYEYSHGTTIHGIQSKIEKYRLEPQAYYNSVKQIMRSINKNAPHKPMAVTGLGVGTLSCVAEKNQPIDLYEIDPIVIDVAKNSGFFSYLKDCNGQKNIIQGDARIALQKAQNNYYNLMIMDAYSSDALPTHLLTKEAFQIYLDKLHKDGVMFINISNRFVDLKPVLAAFAKYYSLYGYAAIFVEKPDLTKDHLKYSSYWVALSKNKKVMDDLALSHPWKPFKNEKTILWTDDYSSIFSVLKLF